MKKAVKFILEILFSLSLLMLTQFTQEDCYMWQYQVVATAFWASGILRFMGHENEWKEEMCDTAKDAVVALLFVPIWYWLSGRVEELDVSFAYTVMWLICLAVILWITKKQVEMSGKAAYYTHAAMPVIAVLLIRCNVSIICAVIAAGVLVGLVDYLLYIKKSKHKK